MAFRAHYSGSSSRVPALIIRNLRPTLYIVPDQCSYEAKMMEQKQTCECGSDLMFTVGARTINRYGHQRLIFSTDCPACGATVMFDFRDQRETG